MQINTLVLGPLQTNCYLLWKEKNKETLIIDPADDANFISEKILELKLQPRAILATHGHFDHLLAANELQLAFSIPFYINQKDLFLLNKISQNASFWLKREICELPPNKILFFPPKEQKITINNFQFIFIPTPGHTPGSSCFYFPEEKILFSGDTLFADSIGRTDFSYSSSNDLKNSLQKIFSLPTKTTIYPGHGNNFLLNNITY